MARAQILGSLLLATGALLIGACATPSETTSAPTQSLDDKYFQKEVRKYAKYQYEGRTIYCQNVRNVATLVHHKQCITEEALRQRVEMARRERNKVQPPVLAGAGQGGIGG